MKGRLPPGPPLPAWVQGLAFGARPMGFIRACQRRYGDRITLRMPRFGSYVYLADPDDIRTVFRGDPKVYRAGEANGLVLAEILGSSSVLVTDGAAHDRARRLMAPPFHGPAVRRQVELMAEIAGAEVDDWPVGEPFAALPRMRAITLEVILRTVIGVSDATRLAELREALPPMVDLGGINVLQFVFPALRDYWPWRRFREVEDRADAALYEEIARCRSDRTIDDRTDVLAMLVRARDEDGSGLSDGELRDQLITLLLAGHETTATGLAWTFERLVRNPSVLARAQEAVVRDDDDYLDAVVVESLRVRPVIIDIARRLSAPVELAGYHLPAGTLVSPAIALVHTTDRHHPDPLTFDPSRWLEHHPDPSVWLPFGGGNRRCLGATFATTEMRIVLKETLRRVELTTTDAPGERPKVRHVTVVPHSGAVLKVRSRRSVTAPAS
jgi:cytochrome P450 family 135